MAFVLVVDTCIAGVMIDISTTVFVEAHAVTYDFTLLNLIQISRPALNLHFSSRGVFVRLVSGAPCRKVVQRGSCSSESA